MAAAVAAASRYPSPRPAVSRYVQASAAVGLMAYASLLRPYQRHSHIPELVCGFNNKDYLLCVLFVVFETLLLIVSSCSAFKPQESQ